MLLSSSHAPGLLSACRSAAAAPSNVGVIDVGAALAPDLPRGTPAPEASLRRKRTLSECQISLHVLATGDTPQSPLRPQS
jgi:hypothetical protein